ncbi:UNVERIFIED_CONTAM: hypothetical protein FKN15_034788 [Acipenser sinensis]
MTSELGGSAEDTQIFGCGGVAQVTTSSLTRGEYLSINLAFAFGVTFGVHVSRGVSGAHLNPAVSLAMCLLGRLPWRKLPVYALFQLLGAFVAAATVYAQYRDAIMQYSGGNLTVTGPFETASIFATYPAPHLSILNGFVDQPPCSCASSPWMIPGTARLPRVCSPCWSASWSWGSAFNPARDLGPRLFTCVGGWGVEVFSAGRHWWWVPLLGPMVGSLVGTAVYWLLIELHHPAQEGALEDCQTVTNKSAIELEEGASKPGGGGAKDGEHRGGGHHQAAVEPQKLS